MDIDRIRNMLHSIREGELSVDQGVDALRQLPFENIGFASIDHHRKLRKGFPEVVYAPGKDCEQLVTILSAIIEKGGPALATRVSEEQAEAVQGKLPEVSYRRDANALYWCSVEDCGPDSGLDMVLVVTAGTADIPVAEEACLTLELMRQPVDRMYDVGVAGIHRLFAGMDRIEKAGVLVVVAGMDGALPAIVAGMASAPVIAVPASSGYGASFGGVAALLTMLNSCATGVAVVNIDNGFGAGTMAAMINRRRGTVPTACDTK